MVKKEEGEDGVGFFVRVNRCLKIETLSLLSLQNIILLLKIKKTVAVSTCPSKLYKARFENQYVASGLTSILSTSKNHRLSLRILK